MTSILLCSFFILNYVFIYENGLSTQPTWNLFFFLATQPSNIVASLFRLNEEEGNTCILLRVDAVIEVKFKTKLGSEDVSCKLNFFDSKLCL